MLDLLTLTVLKQYVEKVVIEKENKVISVNGKDGAVVLTAADIGSISIEEAQALIDQALEEAKQSGAFKGEKGDPGESFKITKVYPSVQAMNDDFASLDVRMGDFVVISTGDVNDPDNAKLFVKGQNEFDFIADFSGAQGESTAWGKITPAQPVAQPMMMSMGSIENEQSTSTNYYSHIIYFHYTPKCYGLFQVINRNPQNIDISNLIGIYPVQGKLYEKSKIYDLAYIDFSSEKPILYNFTEKGYNQVKNGTITVDNSITNLV